MTHRLPAIIALAYFAAILAVSIVASDLAVLQWFHDDSFFYIKTAQNMRAGFGSTFDGLNTTNGYHPLWLLVLVGLAHLQPLTDFAALRVIMPVHAALIGITVLLADQVLRNAMTPPTWRALCAVAIIGATGFVDFGMEAGVLNACAWGLLALITRGESNGPGSRVAIGVLSALTVAARNDAILLAGALGGAMLGAALCDRASRRQYVTSAVCIIIPAVGMWIVLAVHNQLAFGHAATISAHLKTRWPPAWSGDRVLFGKAGTWSRMWLCEILACGSLLILAKIVRREIPPGDPGLTRLFWILAGAAAYVAAHTAVVWTAVTLAPGSWYFSLGLSIMLAITILLASRLVVSRLAARAAALLVSLGILVCVLGVGMYLRPRFSTPAPAPPYVIAEWLRNQTSPDDIIYQVDAAGIVGHFSHRSVVNGDGLINGWRYREAVLAGDVPDYLDALGVTWVVTTERERNGRAGVTLPLWSARPVKLGSAPVEAALVKSDTFRVFRVDDFVFADGTASHP